MKRRIVKVKVFIQLIVNQGVNRYPIRHVGDLHFDRKQKKITKKNSNNDNNNNDNNNNYEVEERNKSRKNENECQGIVKCNEKKNQEKEKEKKTRKKKGKERKQPPVNWNCKTSRKQRLPSQCGQSHDILYLKNSKIKKVKYHEIARVENASLISR